MTTQSQLDDLEHLVSLTRNRIRLFKLIRGASIVELLTVGWLVVSVGLDMLTPMAIPLRIVSWAGFWIILAATATLAVAIPMLKRLEKQHVALRIEKSVGGMHNRLVTVLDLKERAADQAADINPAFAQRLLNQTHEQLNQFSVEKVADPKPMLKTVLGASASVAVVVLMVMLFNDRMPTALARIFMPTSDIAPVTSITIKATGNMEVLQGEQATIRASITRGEVESTGGLKVKLKDTSGGGEWYTHPMEGDDGKYTFDVNDLNANFEYKILGGGTWTKTYNIKMVSRPVIESVATAYTLPRYMGLPGEYAVDEGAQFLSAPKGSTITIRSKVTGEVARGQIRLYTAESKGIKQRVVREHVWVEDRTPDDAVFMDNRPWRWSTNNPFSGNSLHRFNWDQEPYGFRTKFTKLSVEPDQAVFVYARFDQVNTPQRFMASFEDATTVYRLTWGTPNEPVNDNKQPDAMASLGKPVQDIHIGGIPSGDSWMRLEVSLEKMLGVRPGVTKRFTGVYFEVDGGQVDLDRVGKLEYSNADINKTRLTAGGTVAMSNRGRDEKTNEWIGEIELNKDVHYAVQFHNSIGHPNLPMKPFPIKSTEDQSPTIVIEKPATDVTLPQPAPLPVVVRAFDDWGVKTVSIQIARQGREDVHFGPSDPVVHYPDDPQTSRLVLTAIDPAKYNLKPGDHIFFRFVVEDRHPSGHRVFSSAIRLAIAQPNSPLAQKQPADLKRLQDDVEKLIQRQEEIADATADLLKDTPDALDKVVDKVKNDDGFKDAEGKPLDNDAVEEALNQFAEKNLTPEQREKVDNLAEQINTQKQQLNELAQDLVEAAKETQDSPIAPPLEANQLGNLAQDAAEQAQQQPDGNDDSLQPAVEQLAEGKEPAEDRVGELQDIQRDLQRLQEDRDALQNDPENFGEQQQQRMVEQAAEEALDQLAQLGEQLAQQQQDINELQDEQGDLQQQAEQANQDQAGEVGNQQNNLDNRANDEIQETNQLIPEELAQNDVQQVQPWERQANQQNAQEPGNAEANPQQNNQQPGQEGNPQQGQNAEQQPGENAGQQPGQNGEQQQGQQPGQNGEQQDRQQPGQNGEQAGQQQGQNGQQPGQGNQQGQQGLAQHQEQVQEALGDADQNLGEARENLNNLSNQLAQALQEAQGQQPGEGQQAQQGQGQQGQEGHQQGQDQQGQGQQGQGQQGQGQQGQGQQGQGQQGQGQQGQGQQGQGQGQGQSQQSGQSPGQGQSQTPGQGQGQGPGSGPAAQRLAELLQSPNLLAALKAAAAAAQQQQRQAMIDQAQQNQQETQGTPTQSAESAGGQGTTPADSIGGPRPDDTNVAGKIPPGDRVGLYKLPPKIREPLLQGMAERGPKGYQELIDAYYKQLSKEADE